ncbi:MlaE family ABC transporter permease [Neoehrlichia mikurensis]|nr:ABC transporter permease [Neoehrlichia mikurensis]
MVILIGRFFIKFLIRIGHAFIFLIESIYHCFIPPYYLYIMFKQLVETCFFSLPIVGITSVFTGGAIMLQNTLISSKTVSGEFMAGIVAIAIVRELGPVLIGLIIAGRVGAAIAAEIGTMRITEQIDALVTLDTHPLKYLGATRIIASIIAMPILILCADIIGIYGGYIVGFLNLGYSYDVYLRGVASFVHMEDITLGLIKALSFGLIISLTGCYSGYHCSGGARGVGVATTSTVVMSSTFIILLNYIITIFYS